MFRVRRPVRLVLALAGLLLLGAACTNGSDDGNGDEGQTPVATGPTGATGSTGGGSAAASIRAVNFAFDPGEVEVASGAELEVRNAAASTPHTFTVLDTEIDVELGGMESETVTIDLDPGTYGFECRFHPQMTGTLTVT